MTRPTLFRSPSSVFSCPQKLQRGLDSIPMLSRRSSCLRYTGVCESHPQSGINYSVKATAYETNVKNYQGIGSHHPRLLVRYCVSVNQKGLMTGCVYRKKKCTDVFRRMHLDGRDVGKIIAHTNAYLAAR